MEDKEQWYRMAQDLLPAALSPYVDLVLSPRVEDGWYMFRGVRYEAVPDRPYDFVFVDGPDFDAPSDGTLTFDFFVSSIQQANRLGGPAEKFIFCGNALAAGIAKWGQKFGIVRQDAKSKSLGFMIDTILIPGIAAPVHVVPSYDFADRSEMGIVDFRGLKIAEFPPMKVDKGPANYGIQTDGKYTYKTQMFRRFGLMCTNGWSQGIFTNVDRIAA